MFTDVRHCAEFPPAIPVDAGQGNESDALPPPRAISAMENPLWIM
jgi:hypothetical protein